MESYFFVPANRLHKLESMQQLNVDYLIIDLEDAIKSSERTTFIEALEDESICRTIYIRVPIYTVENKFDLDLFLQLKRLGYTNFIFPKLKDKADFERIVVHIESTNKIILLVETPLFLLELKEVLQVYHDRILGVGLGSHDLMNYLNAVHTLSNLDYYRSFLLLVGKAYGLKVFDIASMELVDAEELKIEILDGFNKGFDAKFYIHPWQIEVKDTIAFYTEKDLTWAKKVYKEYQKVGDMQEFNPIVVDGEIIEKLHLNKVFTIIKYFERYDTK